MSIKDYINYKRTKSQLKKAHTRHVYA